MHRTYVSDIERGARNVSLESIDKLAAALEVSVPSLFIKSNSSDLMESPPLNPVTGDELVDILLVEDRQDDLEMAMQALHGARMANRIHSVRDGAAALEFIFCKGEYVHRSPDDLPQLILLDLGLPKVSGLEVLRQIKSHPGTKQISVVVLTISMEDRDLEASRRLGADAYIVKPVDFRNLSEVTPSLQMQWALLKSMHPMARAGIGCRMT